MTKNKLLGDYFAYLAYKGRCYGLLALEKDAEECPDVDIAVMIESTIEYELDVAYALIDELLETNPVKGEILQLWMDYTFSDLLYEAYLSQLDALVGETINRPDFEGAGYYEDVSFVAYMLTFPEYIEVLKAAKKIVGTIAVCKAIAPTRRHVKDANYVITMENLGKKLHLKPFVKVVSDHEQKDATRVVLEAVKELLCL